MKLLCMRTIQAVNHQHEKPLGNRVGVVGLTLTEEIMAG